MYVVDPTGDSVQLDSHWVGPSPPGISGGALRTMSFQGGRQSAMNPTSEVCASALESTCSGLRAQASLCTDCVCNVDNHAALKAAACFNSDAVAYCNPGEEEAEEDKQMRRFVLGVSAESAASLRVRWSGRICAHRHAS